ncbi:DNA-directed DNA polymerase [Tanacetum coccineum]
MLGKLGFVRLDYSDYGRRMVKEVRVEIHGFNFLVDFVVIDYANEGEMRIDITMLEDDMNIDTMLASLVEDVVKVRSTSDELVKMGKANRNKSYNVNKLTPPALPKIKEIPPISSTALPPVYHPLSPKHKEKILEALDRKYKELEEQKPIVEVLENYMVYRKKLDEVMMGRARLENKEFSDEEKSRLIKHGLPKKLCDPGNFVIPVRINGTTQMSALADTRASVSVLPYTLYKNLWLSDPRPYHSNLTMADNTQAKAMGEVDEDEDWLGCFKVGRDEDGN